MTLSRNFVFAAVLAGMTLASTQIVEAAEATVPMEATVPLDNSPDYRATSPGNWIITGRKAQDGGFFCSMSHVTEQGTYTIFTGLQTNPVFVHQSIFMPWSGSTENLKASVVTDGVRGDVLSINAMKGTAVIPLSILQLRYLVETMGSKKDFAVVIGSGTSGEEIIHFPLDGAQRAASKQSECIEIMRPAEHTP